VSPIPALFQASTQDDESVAQMVALLDVQDGVAVCEAPAGLGDRNSRGTSFEDSSVDLVWCERVLQHLNDPDAAINDIARVLRPGGRAVLLDADHGTRIISDLDPDVASAFIRASLATLTNPYAARHIPAQVRRAGLTLDPDVGSSAFIFSSDMLLRSQVVQRAADDAVESGGLARDVAAAAVGAVHAAAERGEAFAAITVFGFVARKLDGRRAP
jgi:SAM-dependent methyltransferase